MDGSFEDGSFDGRLGEGKERRKGNSSVRHGAGGEQRGSAVTESTSTAATNREDDEQG
jgi:hypothetical protein